MHQPASDSRADRDRPVQRRESHTARVVVIGFMHEANALASPTRLADGVDANARGLSDGWETGPVCRRLAELGGVEVVGGPVWEFGAGGPLDDSDFEAVRRGIVASLRVAAAEAPIDGVVFLGHGAGRSTSDLDTDATVLGDVRDIAGDAPIVAVLDFHANLSERMCELVDIVIGYRTNPHVDVVERSIEAAETMHRLLVTGARTVIAHCKAPLVLPQLAQLTTPGEPLSNVMLEAARLADDPLDSDVLAVSVFGGFSLSDVPDAGLSVCVSATSGHAERAVEIAERLAVAVWERRPSFRLRATPLADAVAIARDAAAGRRDPVILADLADNPGGGAPGNTTFLLAALLEAGLTDAVMALHCDARVVEAARRAGAGATIRVTFNEGSRSALASPLTVDAEVLGLADGTFVPTVGVYRGSRRDPGPACALRVDGIRIAVASRRVQCADPDTFRHVGIEPADARVVAVKSRGHFRAGFAELFDADRVVEVDAPGVATCDLDSIEWRNLPRPSFPFDVDIDWIPRARLHGAVT